MASDPAQQTSDTDLRGATSVDSSSSEATSTTGAGRRGQGSDDPGRVVVELVGDDDRDGGLVDSSLVHDADLGPGPELADHPASEIGSVQWT